MATEKVSFPEIEITPEDIQAFGEEKKLANGARVKVIVESATPGLRDPSDGREGKDLVLNCKLQVLDPSDGSTRIKGGTLYDNIVIPVRNTNYANHKVWPYGPGMFAAFVDAIDPEVAKELKGPERSEALLNYAKELCASQGEGLLMKTYFTTLKHSVSKQDGRTFVNVDRRSSEEPAEGLTPVDALFTMVGGASGDAETAKPAKGNGKSGKAAPARATKGKH